jgi:hypothetical protein
MSGTTGEVPRYLFTLQTPTNIPPAKWTRNISRVRFAEIWKMCGTIQKDVWQLINPSSPVWLLEGCGRGYIIGHFDKERLIANVIVKGMQYFITLVTAVYRIPRFLSRKKLLFPKDNQSFKNSRRRAAPGRCQRHIERCDQRDATRAGPRASSPNDIATYLPIFNVPRRYCDN